MNWITDTKFLVGLAVGYLVLPRVLKPVMDKLRSVSAPAAS